MKKSPTALPIYFDGWMPPRKEGLLPSVKATWDGRMLQLFTQDLEQGEVDMRLLQCAPEMLEELKLAQVLIFRLEGHSVRYQAIGKLLDKVGGK